MKILTTVNNAYRPICLSFLVLLMFNCLGLGQPTPNSMRVSGVVTDANGAAVAGAKVTLKDPATNKEISTTTNADGFYRFSNVGAGKYEITVEAAGFPNELIKDVEVKASQNKTVDIKMPVRQSASVTPAPDPQQRVGNIGGQVMDRQNADGTHDLLTDFKSDVPIDTVKLSIRGLGEKITIAHLPQNWVSKYDAKSGELSLTRGPQGLPLFEIKARFNVPKSWAAQLEEFLKKGVEFDFSFGDIRYGSRFVEVKDADPMKIVTPDKAAEIPKTIRPGESFSITPLEVFRGGIWQLGIGDKLYEEYPDEPPQLDLQKIAQYLPDQKKAGEEMERQLQQRQPVLSELPLSGRLFHIPRDAQLPPGGNVSLTYTDEYGETLVRGPAAISLLPPLIAFRLALAAPRLFECTPKLFQGDRLCVCGYFPNLFSRQQLLLDGKRLNHPRSGSTDIVVFLPQNLAPGKHVITWDVPAFDGFYNPEPGRAKPSATERVEFIVLEAKGTMDRDKLNSGERTDMHLRIFGTDEKLPIELTNETRDVIELEGGVRQVINTSGGSNNTLTRWVKAQKTGQPIANFNIRYRLTVPPCPCKPERLSEFLPLSGVLTKTPEKPTGDQTSEPREDCELIMLEYTKLSIEYGKLQSDFKKALEWCNTLDDGTVAGRDLRDQWRAKATAVFTESNIFEGAGLKELREKMLALLARYRACREGKPAAGQ